MIRRRIRVTGQVQGVGYRYACRREAESRRLSGWVTNCDDGAVEAEFEGPPDAVQAMIDWCHRGPAMAAVRRAQVSEARPTGETGFRVV